MPQVQFATAVQKISPSHWPVPTTEDALWATICDSLLTIAERLHAWGQQLKRPSPPDQQTMDEAADGLDQLDTSLLDLDSWLSDHSSPGWPELQQGLSLAREQHLNSPTIAGLYTYLRWDKDPQRSTEPATIKWYDQQRIDAGRAIIVFANALRQAVGIAQGCRTNPAPDGASSYTVPSA